MLKKLLSAVLCVALLVMPLSGMIGMSVSASNIQPTITFNIDPYATVSPQTTITVSYEARGGYTLSACDTRLEGVSLGTGSSVSFTPAAQGLSDGLYTLMAKATDSAGVTTYEPLTFAVSTTAESDYTLKNGVVSSAQPVVTYAAQALDFSAFYSSTQDGTLSLNNLGIYNEQNIYDLKYTDVAVDASSVSGIPYQVFAINLNGKTSGEVAVTYSGSTLKGERIAVKVYDAKKADWDTIGTITGTGTVSELVSVSQYNCGGKIYAAAVLDYVTNGSDTMIWSTDPQHYTKFADLNEYYYKIYQYAAAQYQNGEAGYIFTTGDLVDDRPTAAVAPRQWSVSDKAMSYAEAVGMPNGLVSGNHDVADFKNPDYTAGANTSSDYSMFAKTFPADRYNNERWFGGSLNNNTSHFDLITIGNVDFIILFLGYGFEADPETIAWANDVLETYRHRTAIVTTHQYLQNNIATYGPDGRGKLIYDTIVDPNPNVKMVLCGHDDGSLCLEKTASDGRIVYEILADYQFVEAEDPDFYANEHYIATVPHCCGDGYVRLLTVEGDTLQSVTYSPVTDRYNPYGDRENLTLTLDHKAYARTLTTSYFSAAVLGNETTATDVDRVAMIGSGETATYSPVLYATTPAQPDDGAFRPAATPTGTFYRQTPTATPTVSVKNDLLAAVGLSDGAVNTGWAAYGNYNTNPLNFVVDLEKTPYFYYSFTQPAESDFTFAFISDTRSLQWLTFRDATGDGAFLNTMSANWDSYKAWEQYTTTSETGCIDMREYITDPNATTIEIEQLTLYNHLGKNVTLNYMFFGSDDGRSTSSLQASADKNALKALITEASAINTSSFVSAGVNELSAAISQANTALSGRYYDIEPAYRRLSNAIGALTPIKQTISESSLANIKNYSLMTGSWENQSVPILTQHDDGFIMDNPAPTSAMWAAVANWDAYTVHPEQGKMYLKLDVDADSAWALHLHITQNGVSNIVHLNGGIENGFSSAGADGMEGVFQGIYDISDAFEMCGFDPSATFEVTGLQIYIVGYGARADICHLQFFTAASDGVTDGGNLFRAIDRAALRTQSHYTAASWSAMQTALTAANAALKDTSLAESDLNLKALALNNAIDALVYAGSFPETKGSLLPSDPGMWKPSAAGAITANRVQTITTIQNTTGAFPFMDYTLEEPMRVFIDETRLVADFDVGSAANIYLFVDDITVPLIPYIKDTVISGDIPAGTYKIDVPLSEITELQGKTSANIQLVRVYSVGDAASSAVTLRTLRIAEYSDYAWDETMTEYGVAATPSAPYYSHCAPVAPEVANKVDLLASLGLDDQPTINAWQSTPVNIKLDLNKTPYLYYSIAVPDGGDFTFGLYNDMTYAPYFVFRDAASTGSLMSSTVEKWDNSGGLQYVRQSETGCIDLRTLTNEAGITNWNIHSVTFYNMGGKDVVISYMFFGSEPTYVEQNIDVGADTDILMGDVNGDGKVTTFDARMVMTEILGATNVFTSYQKKVADLSGNGVLSTTDVRLILLKALSN